MRARRLITALGGLAILGTLAAGLAPAASAAPAKSVVPVTTTIDGHMAVRIDSLGKAGLKALAVSAPFALRDNSGNGAYVSAAAGNPATVNGAHVAMFQTPHLFGHVSSSGAWPFTPGSGYNSLYDGKTVNEIIGANGSCLANEGSGFSIVWWRACQEAPAWEWVGIGFWLVNVQVTNEHANLYPLGSAMTANCNSAGCTIPVKTGPNGGQSNQFNQWGFVSN